MRIILVLPDSPLPFRNASSRWFYVLLRGLVARGHDVTAFTAVRQEEEREEARQLFPAPRYDLRCFPHQEGKGWLGKWNSYRRPYSYPFHPDLRRELDAVLDQDFDVLHLESQWAGWLGQKHAAKSVLNVHSLYFIDSELSAGTGSWTERIRTRRVVAAEKSLLRSFPHIRCLSQPMAGHIRTINPTADVRIIPLCLDANLYPFKERPPVSPPTLGLIGSFNWGPTYSAAIRLLKNLWPSVEARIPGVRLMLVGREALSALGPHLPAERQNIMIEENVPDTIPYFEQMTALAYAPAAGTGMKIKVMEAFALGIPVVTNSSGVEGLPAVDGIHAGIAEDDDGLVQRCVHVLLNAETQAAWRGAARKLLMDHCDPDKAVTSLEPLYRSL